jgi:hypothetical protein
LSHSEDDFPTEEGDDALVQAAGHVSRRKVLERMAIVGGATLWTPPLVQIIVAKAASASAPPFPKPIIPGGDSQGYHRPWEPPITNPTSTGISPSWSS